VAEKMPLSGHCLITAAGTLYSLMGQSYALVIRDDHTDPLVVMRLDDFADLAK
jgi:hypothetical protein